MNKMYKINYSGGGHHVFVYQSLLQKEQASGFKIAR